MVTVAALPMYDWAEVRQETDSEWAELRSRLHEIADGWPDSLTRRNAELPPVPGGIMSAEGELLSPDPATMPPDELNFHALWNHPKLAFAQTCWGPLELGLADHVSVVGQPDYSAYEGGQGIYYRSAILTRKTAGKASISVPDNPLPQFDPAEFRGLKFAFNGPDSMSGIMAFRRDLAVCGAVESEAHFEQFWSGLTVSGGHRQSVVEVAEGRADVATIDCRTLDLCRRFEPALSELRIAGWTAQRKGLPYIAAPKLAQPINLASHG